jgi:glycosyltransferase involved in cell wall biosynthesis
MDITLVCDPITSWEGSVRPALYLAEELAKCHNVLVVSPYIRGDVEKALLIKGITPLNLLSKFLMKGFGSSAVWLEAWLREAFLKLNSRRVQNESSLIINFSQVFSVPSHVWYSQGPPSMALDDMKREFSRFFKFAYKVVRPIIRYADKNLIKNLDEDSSIIIANSKFCALMYSMFGVHVDDVIYPPLNRYTFRPSTSNPTSDYILTYFGKETKFSVIKRIADLGVKIRAFGSKTPFINKNLLKHPNIKFLGRLSTESLVKAYSNALLTLFPFLHEPFGYIPIESMACGTPTLTYGMQGPGEYVVNGESGWLASDDASIVKKAVEIWREGYPSEMRKNCIERSMAFDGKIYVEKWLKLLNSLDVI